MKDTQHSWVKHLVDWGPLVAFFIAFKTGGIMQATVVLIVVTVALTSLGYALTRRIQPMPLVTLVIVCIFGGLTIWLQDETFIKMKPTIILTLFAVVLIGGLMIGKPLLKFLMGSALELDDAGWRKLTLRFGLFFLATACLNEIVWRTQSDRPLGRLQGVRHPRPQPGVHDDADSAHHAAPDQTAFRIDLRA